MVDVSKSFEITENGILLSDDANGGRIVWFGGGSAVPSHSAPEGSRYFRTSPAEQYKQDGPGEGTNWVLDDQGGGGGNASYAALKADHVSSPLAVDLTAEVWEKYEDFNAELESSILTIDLPNNKMVVGSGGAGVYIISFTLNGTFNTAGKFAGSVYKNGTRMDMSIAHGDYSNGQNDFVSGTCMMNLADNDELEFWVKSSNTNQDPDVESVILAAHRVSGGAQGPQGPAGETNADGGNAFTVYPAIDIDGGSA